jgi:hypothetical protein
MNELKTYNVQDGDVKDIRINFCRIMYNFIETIPWFLLNLSLSLAGLCILFPIGMYLRYLAEKARKSALAGSNVKIRGVDVMASKKMTTALMLYPFLCTGFTIWFYFVLGYL